MRQAFTRTNMIFLVCCAALIELPQVYAGSIKKIEGTLSPDLQGDPWMDLVITISSVTDAELVLRTDEDQGYLGRIEFRLPDAENPGQYIQTAAGDGLPDNNHGFYWDKLGTTPAVVNNIAADDNELVYNIRILENTTDKRQKLADLLKTTDDSKTIKVRVNFFAKDTSGQLKPGPDVDGLIEQSFALPNAAPGGVAVAGTHKSFTVKWSLASIVPYSDSKDRAVASVVVIVAKNTGATYDLNEAAKVTTGGEDPATQGACTLTPPGENGQSCIACDDEVSTFLDIDRLKEIPGLELSRGVGNSGAVTIGEVENEQPYTIALQYKNGLKRSECFNVTGLDNYTMLELNGEEGAKPEDLRCFIATAAFGSPFHRHVRVFRWFRDRYLSRNSLGRMLVQQYYLYSPAMAQFIADREPLRVLARLVLTPVAGVLYFGQWLSQNVLNAYVALLLIGAAIVGYFFRRPAR